MRQKIELIITVIGVIVLIFLLRQDMSPLRRKPILQISQSPISKNIESPSFMLDEKEESGKGEWGRDPFSFSSSIPSIGIEGLVLNGIVWDRENPYAIINDNIVKKGDRVLNMLILEIEEKRVILEESPDRHYILQLE